MLKLNQFEARHPIKDLKRRVWGESKDIKVPTFSILIILKHFFLLLQVQRVVVVVVFNLKGIGNATLDISN